MSTNASRKSPSASNATGQVVFYAADLSRYVMEDDGQSRSQGSNFDALTRALMLAWAEIPCPTCRARHRRRERRRAIARARSTASEPVTTLLAKAGMTPEEARALVWEYEDTGKIPRACKRCGGEGKILVRVTEAMRRDPKIERFPTGSSKRGRPPDTTGEATSLLSMARIGSLLARLREQHWQSAAALRIWFAPGGQQLTRLFHLTAAGLRLLDLKDQQQANSAFLAAETRRRYRGEPDEIRDALYERAEEEAGQLLEAAVGRWNAVCSAIEQDCDKRLAAAVKRESARELGKVGT